MEHSSEGPDQMPRNRPEKPDLAGGTSQPSHTSSDLRGSQRSGRSANEDESNREGGLPASGNASSQNRVDPSSVQSRAEE